MTLDKPLDAIAPDGQSSPVQEGRLFTLDDLWSKISAEIKTINSRLDNMNTIPSQIPTLSDKIIHIESRLEAVKSSQATKITEVDSIANEVQGRQERSNNLIIYKLTESTDEGTTSDFSRIKEILG